MLEVCTGEQQYIIDYYCALFDNVNNHLFVRAFFFEINFDILFKRKINIFIFVWNLWILLYINSTKQCIKQIH